MRSNPLPAWHYFLWSILFVLCTAVFAAEDAVAPAKGPLGSATNPITVGVLQVEPFAMLHDGEYTGVAVDIWSHIASDNNWHYRYVSAGTNYHNAVLSTAKGSYDVLLGNFSTYYERAKLVHFSRPYLLNYVAILTTVQHGNIFVTAFSIFVRFILPIAAIMAGVLVVFSFLLSRTRDLTSEKTFSENVFYVVMSFFQGQITSELGRAKCPPSRLIVICLAFFSAVFVTTLSAVLTGSVVTMHLPSDPFVKLQDVRDKRFVLESGSTFSRTVRSLGGLVHEVEGMHEASDFYYKNRHHYAGFVADQALVSMLDKQNPDRSIIASAINLRNDELVLVFNKQFPLVSQVDSGIMKLQDSNLSIQICSRYLGVDSKLCVL